MSPQHIVDVIDNDLSEFVGSKSVVLLSFPSPALQVAIQLVDRSGTCESLCIDWELPCVRGSVPDPSPGAKLRLLNPITIRKHEQPFREQGMDGDAALWSVLSRKETSLFPNFWCPVTVKNTIFTFDAHQKATLVVCQCLHPARTAGNKKHGAEFDGTHATSWK